MSDTGLLSLALFETTPVVIESMRWNVYRPICQFLRGCGPWIIEYGGIALLVGCPHASCPALHADASQGVNAATSA